MIYLSGFSFSQLFFGPLSDHFGRRPILLCGLSGFVIGSFLCAIASSVEILLLFRLFQGLSIGAASVSARVIMRDCFSGYQLMKVASYTGIAYSLIPLTAPLIGGYIQKYTHWRMIFVSLISLG